MSFAVRKKVSRVSVYVVSVVTAVAPLKWRFSGRVQTFMVRYLVSVAHRCGTSGSVATCFYF